MVERGERRGGGGGSLALAKLQVRLSYWQGIQNVIQDVTPDVTPERKLLSAYVEHFHKVMRVTRCILEVEVNNP